jgi:glycosyltransferase involved in cell wall biosynthesis
MQLSVCIPVFNEEALITQTVREVVSVVNNLTASYEVIVVNDGSRDDTELKLWSLAQKNPRVKVLSLSRNFGHEAAMLAGLDYATGKAVIVMDGDLQHPPIKIPEMLEAFNAGSDVVMMVRSSNTVVSWPRRLATRAFYKLLNALSSQGTFLEEASDFFLLSQRATKAITTHYREKMLYLRGFARAIGFEQSFITYIPAPRTAGYSKYNMGALLLHSFNSIILFSDKPLHAAIFTGGLFSVFSITLALYSLVMKFLLQSVLPGYTTLVVFFSFAIGVQLMFMGVLAQYIRSILHEVRSRPHYLVDQSINLTQK